MRNDEDKDRRDQTGRGAMHSVVASQLSTAEQRETVRQGLPIVANIIARAHLRRQASAGASGPPLDGGAEG